MPAAPTDFPLQPLLERWQRLTPDMQAFARGYMGSACEQARAALDLVEAMAAEEAAKRAQIAPRLGRSRLRLVS